LKHKENEQEVKVDSDSAMSTTRDAAKNELDVSNDSPRKPMKTKKPTVAWNEKMNEEVNSAT
jgi:hypothetical protein